MEAMASDLEQVQELLPSDFRGVPTWVSVKPSRSVPPAAPGPGPAAVAAAGAAASRRVAWRRRGTAASYSATFAGQ
jgi:hypothetical protein